jgi:hypothetical protein
MKYQTNESLGPFINQWGCFLMCILEKVEIFSPGFKFSNSDVCAIYTEGMRRGYIQAEVFDEYKRPKDGCDILNQCGVFNLAAIMFNLRVRCIDYRIEKSTYIPVGNETEILELKRIGHKCSHFVSGNGNSGVNLKAELEFDPIEGGSITARDGWIETKRIFLISK